MGGKESMTMLMSVQPQDLTIELQALAGRVNQLADQATYVADRTHDTLFGRQGVMEQIGKLATDKGPAEPLGPAEVAQRDLRDLRDDTQGDGAEIEQIASEIWDRLNRIIDLLAA